MPGLLQRSDQDCASSRAGSFYNNFVGTSKTITGSRTNGLRRQGWHLTTFWALIPKNVLNILPPHMPWSPSVDGKEVIQPPVHFRNWASQRQRHSWLCVHRR